MRPLCAAWLAGAVGLAGCAHAGSKSVAASPGAAAACRAPSPAVMAELDRLLKSVGRHATHSNVCVDGYGVQVRVERRGACLQSPNQIALRYHVTVSPERGGECSPYPGCAKRPPSTQLDATTVLALEPAADGIRLVVPNEVPGVMTLTPLGQKHDTGCYGVEAPFVPQRLPRPRSAQGSPPG